MDRISRAFYEFMFRDLYGRMTGNAFQDFFSDLMEKAHPGDFIRVRPWGKSGDKKNDGYLRSERMIFQVYAPNELQSVRTVAKIEGDFNGAVTHWRDHFDRWVFVHNSVGGLGPDVTKKLLELNGSQDISVESWGEAELRRKVFGLCDADLALLLGPAPTLRDMLDLGLEVLAPVLDQVAAMPAPECIDLRPPPADKVARNMLSQHVETLLCAGMMRVDLVRKYFGVQSTSQDAIARSFHLHYQELRHAGMSPDEIFGALQRYAGGEAVPGPARQSAVLAVLAFFFEECDIYERDGGRS